MFELLTPQHSILMLSLYVLYLVALGSYRLYLDPIAKFPGPKLAALTLWYELYYDVVKRGRYTFEIEKMHKRYGPIVRINPYELHINDPDYYDQLYVSGAVRKSDKYPWAARMFGKLTSMFGTIDHDLHRIRRAAIAPFLSKQSVQRLEPTVQSVVNKLVIRFQNLQGSATSVNLIDAFAALTGDIIGQYAFARPYGLMDGLDFNPQWHKAWMSVSELGHMFKQFAWLEPTMRNMPIWLVKMLSPQTMALLNIQDALKKQVREVEADIQAGRKNTGQRTVFYDVLTNDKIRAEEKETEHLKTEAQTLVAAGTLTTTHALSTISFHLLDNPNILERLQQELGDLMSNDNPQPTWQQLERLPYLSAIISEGLRIGYGVMHRLQRISPENALHYKGWYIPPGTPVGMSGKMMHDNEIFFPNPRAFSPDRWLQPSAHRLEKYLVPFGMGSRSCLGLNLAYCELYLTIAAVFAPGKFHLELFETDITDVETPHDFVNPCHRADSKGIRVLVR